jgi:hypothetical protein
MVNINLFICKKFVFFEKKWGLLSLRVVAFDGIRISQMAPWAALFKSTTICVFPKYFYDAHAC